MANSFTQEITVFVNSLGPEAQKALAAQAFKVRDEVVQQATSRHGVAPLTESAVDGRRTEDYASVRPDGVIFEQWDYRAEIVKVCFDELRARSPVHTGKYRDSHFVMLDGVGLAPLEVPTAAQLIDIAEITITNPVPYARKIEVGVTKAGRAFVVNTDPHVFEAAMVAVRRAFGTVARLDFAFVDLENAYMPRGSTRRHGNRRARSRSERMRYPAIVITR